MSLTEFANICIMQSSNSLQTVYKQIDEMVSEHYRFSVKVVPMISNMELMSEPVVAYVGFLFKYRQYIHTNMLMAEQMNQEDIKTFIDFLNNIITSVDNMIRLIDMSIAFKDAYVDTASKYPPLRKFDSQLIIDLMWLFSPDHMQIFRSILQDCTLDRVKTEPGRREYMYSMVEKLRTKRII